MRQHNFVFDIENNRLGIARAICSEDPNQIFYERQLVDSGQRYALDPTHTESLEQSCFLESMNGYQPKRKSHPPPNKVKLNENLD